MDNEELLNQIGLLLTQLRYARRSLEDIERSTARYTTFAFASALAAGPRFGEPPMFAGALKVYVVNINDLAPGGGLGGFLEGLLGGIGRFFGGLFGGFIGGTISGVTLLWVTGRVERIAASLERIVARLGVPKEPVSQQPVSTGKEAEAGGGTFFDMLGQITDVVNAFTALFQAANNKPEDAARTANPLTPQGERWLAILQTADSLVRGISLVIKGLTLLIPEVIGALAMLIVRLDTIKLAVVELLQFVLREALLLRGVALTVLFDTLSAAAKLAANILAILGLTLQSIITSVFSIFGSVFDAALAAIQFLSDGLQKTINALLKWLVDSVITVLAVVGDTRIFRVAVYAMQTLPYILPSLVQLVRGVSISPTDQTALDDAKKILIAGPSLTGATSAMLPSFPSVSNTLLDPAAVGTLKGTISTSLAGINTAMGDIFGATGKGLTNLSTELDKAASDKTFNDALDKHLGQLRERSDTLAGTLASAQKAAIEHPATGLEAIASAYEKWLASPDGLKTLLGNLTDFFKETPTSGLGAEQSLAAQAIGPTTIDRPRATVEIEDVVIELGPPSESPSPAATMGTPGLILATSPEEMLQQVVELIHELTERGYTFTRGSLLTQV